MDQRLASLEHDAWQPRPTIEEDVPADEKTCERTEGTVKAVEAMHGDSFSAKRVQDGPTTSTSFGVKAEPPALPGRDDVLVENGAAAPTSCLPLEMRLPTTAGGLLSTDEASTTTRITFYQSRLWFCLKEEPDSERT